MGPFAHLVAPGADHPDRARWDARHAEPKPHRGVPPAELVEALCGLRPAPGEALDLAAGLGAFGLELATRGYRVTSADVSPVAAEACRAEAKRRGVALTYLVADLALSRLGAGVADVIVCRRFWDPDLFAQLPAALRPGGALYVEPMSTAHRQHAPGIGAAYLADPAQVEKALSGLTRVRWEAVDDGAQAYLRLLARKS